MAIDVIVPPLGQTVDTVILMSWYKQEGETVDQGEPLYVIETDKANLDIESPGTGILHQVTADAGDEVRVLSVIAHIAQPDEVLQDQPELPSALGVAVSSPVLSSEPMAGSVESQDERPRLFISPRARRLAGQENVPWKTLTGTGPEGAITERDIRSYLVSRSAALEESPVHATLVESGDVLETVPFTGARKDLADRIAYSSTTATPVTLTAEADATALLELRQRLAQDGREVSFIDLLLCVLGRVLQEYPSMNASLIGNSIQVQQQVHIGIAVESDCGLLVPVVRDVDQKRLLQIAEETKMLLDRAQRGQCTPDELQGSTFTLTNLGMYGIDTYSPIIIPPAGAILGFGRIKSHPAIVNDALVNRKIVWLGLTLDHRLEDGVSVARFMQRVIQLVEKPHLMLA